MTDMLAIVGVYYNYFLSFSYIWFSWWCSGSCLHLALAQKTFYLHPPPSGSFTLSLAEEDSAARSTEEEKKAGWKQTKEPEGTETENRFKPSYGCNNAYLNVSKIRRERVPSIYQVVLTQMAQIFHNPVSQFWSWAFVINQKPISNNIILRKNMQWGQLQTDLGPLIAAWQADLHIK